MTIDIEHYQELYDKCVLTTEPVKAMQLRHIADFIIANHQTYLDVEEVSGIPWFVVGAIHYRESDLSFKCHLHNGDPLTARTVHVPRERPHDGAPPFSWQFSATDALSDRAHPFRWGAAGGLEFCERYNGLGYYERAIASPYVWSFTSIYNGGLFIADGSLDMLKKDARPGVAAIFKTLQASGVDLESHPPTHPNGCLH